MFSSFRLAILFVIIEAMVEGKLQPWHRDCSFTQSMQEPLSMLVAEHFNETLQHYYLKDKTYPNDDALLRIWVTEIAFRKEDDTQAIAILQVITGMSNPYVHYFWVILENCEKVKTKGKTTFTFKLVTSIELGLVGSKEEAEYAAIEYEKTWVKNNTPKDPTDPKTNTPHYIRKGFKILAGITFLPFTVIIWLNGGFDDTVSYRKLSWNFDTGKPEMRGGVQLPSAKWTIQRGVFNPEIK